MRPGPIADSVQLLDQDHATCPKHVKTTLLRPGQFADQVHLVEQDHVTRPKHVKTLHFCDLDQLLTTSSCLTRTMLPVQHKDNNTLLLRTGPLAAQAQLHDTDHASRQRTIALPSTEQLSSADQLTNSLRNTLGYLIIGPGSRLIKSGGRGLLSPGAAIIKSWGEIPGSRLIKSKSWVSCWRWSPFGSSQTSPYRLPFSIDFIFPNAFQNQQLRN